jgi:hypothetical protein
MHTLHVRGLQPAADNFSLAVWVSSEFVVLGHACAYSHFRGGSRYFANIAQSGFVYKARTQFKGDFDH